MGLEITGNITKVLPLQSGTSGAGKEWEKQSFIVKTQDQYNNIYCFEVFGAEKVENFNQSHKVGYQVKVEFTVNTNEWKEKYFTSLSAWKIENISTTTSMSEAEKVMDDAHQSGANEDLPF